MSRSSKASAYGAAAERAFAEDRDLIREGVHTGWCDAQFRNGVPVEIKSAMLSTGYFQIYERYHETLADRGGYYGFVVYEPTGRRASSISVKKMKLVRPGRLSLRSLWSPTGGHRDSRKAKLPFEAVF